MNAMSPKACKCVGCKIEGGFDCTESMDMKRLMTDIGLSLLQVQDPDPSINHNGPTKMPDKLDDEMENRFKDWSSSKGVRIDMSSLIGTVPNGANNLQANNEEKSVLKSLRDKVEQLGLKEVSFFPNFKPGPQIGKAKFGKNLEQILSSAKERDIFLSAFNLPGLQAQDTNIRRHINKHRREHDLVMILGAFKLLMLIEVKGGRPGNFEEQFRKYKAYMERSHGKFLDNIEFLPVLARNQTVAQLCDQFQFGIPNAGSQSSFDTWWQTNFLPQNQKGVGPDEMTPLLKSLLMASSLVLTSLPQQLSSATPDSHLIILRKCQWDLFAARPEFAVIQGDDKTGKSMALELGLAFLGKENYNRLLISLESPYQIQNILRNSFFKNSGIDFKCYQKLGDIQPGMLGQDSLICIDNFPSEDMLKPDVKDVLLAVKNKSKYLWLALKEPSIPCEQDCKSLGFTYVKF